jgi:hypothetical protein
MTAPVEVSPAQPSCESCVHYGTPDHAQPCCYCWRSRGGQDRYEARDAEAGSPVFQVISDRLVWNGGTRLDTVTTAGDVFVSRGAAAAHAAVLAQRMLQVVLDDYQVEAGAHKFIGVRDDSTDTQVMFRVVDARFPATDLAKVELRAVRLFL